MDEPAKPPDPSTETPKEMVLRRIEEDRAFVHARYVTDLLEKSTQVIETTLTYLLALFDISSSWSIFLVQNYQEVDLDFKPKLETFTELLVKEGERLSAPLDPLRRQEFLKRLKGHFVARKSHWTSEALKRVRTFN